MPRESRSLTDVQPEVAASAPVPPPPAGPPAMSPVELGRWAWRQLTSMRTALILLFLLALAAIPGSVVPQEAVDSLRASQLEGRPPGPDPDLRAARAVLRLRLAVVRRDLHAAVRLAGGLHRAPQRGLLAGVTRPTAARATSPRPDAATTAATRPPSAPDDVLDRARSLLRARRYRIRDISGDGPVEEAGDAVSAERGYLREAGNLLFHISVLVVLVGFAIGWLFGFKGGVIVVTERRLRQHPEPVRRLPRRRRASTPDELAPFDFTVDDFDVTFIREGREAGMAHEVRRRPRRASRRRRPRPRRQADLGQPPAHHRRHQGVPDRPRLRAAHHGARRQGQRGLLRRRWCSCPRTARSAPSGWSRCPTPKRGTQIGLRGRVLPDVRLHQGDRTVLGLPRRQEPGDLDARLQRRPRSRQRGAAVGLRAATRRASSRSRRPTASRCGSTSPSARARPCPTGSAR